MAIVGALVLPQPIRLDPFYRYQQGGKQGQGVLYRKLHYKHQNLRWLQCASTNYYVIKIH